MEISAQKAGMPPSIKLIYLRKKMRSLVLTIAIITLIGCASTKDEFIFDGSSEASIQRDISYMFKKLPDRKKLEFSIALLAIQFSDVTGVKDFIGDPTMESTNYFILSKKLDGLTYKEVMELASKSPTKVSLDVSTQ